MDRLAIDLGTSNTVAVLRGGDGQVRPVLFDGREPLPSAVHAGAGGVLVAGLDAERLARADPAAFEPNPKRRIDDGTVLLGPHAVAVVDVLAAVLTTVADHAGLHRPTVSADGGAAVAGGVAVPVVPGAVPAVPGGIPTAPGGGSAAPGAGSGVPGAASVVLTVPAGWGTPRREVLADAAARAGLGAVELVSEPVAAAAYFAATHRGEVPPGAALLVVDVGAGTADLAVVRDGRVVAQGGLDVGGLDVDAALVGLLGELVCATTPGVWQRLAAPVTAADRRDRLLLWQEVRAAKESLSRLSVAPVHVPGCPSDPHLTRGELEAVATPLLAPIADLAAALTAAVTTDRAGAVTADPVTDATADPVISTAFDPVIGVTAGPAGDVVDRVTSELGAARTADAAAGGLAAVFLVGGGSRLPLLARLLHTRLGVAPTTVERPETVVAEGALHATDVPAPEVEAVAATGPVPAAPAAARTPLRRRWHSPATALLVLLCFALPFATVSCGLPGGYGRAQVGGTTEYTGFDLASGGAPGVRPADQVRPPDPQRPDRLAPQPPYVAALLLLAGILAAAAVGGDRRRRAVTAALAALAALALVAGQVLVTDRLAAAVVAQSRLPDGKTADDMVGTGAGFWVTVTLLTLLALGNLAASAPASSRFARYTGRAETPGG